ncbi:MAG: tetratricopeptide repeat protein [Bacteroidota bacterium]
MKFFLLFFAFLILFPFNDYGQDEKFTLRKINELKYVYFNSKSDTAKLNSLTLLVNAYYDLSDFTNTLLYNHQLKLLSEKMKLSNTPAIEFAGKKAEAAYFNHIGNVFKKQSNYLQANANFFRSYNLYMAVKDKSNAGVVLSNISATFSGIGNYKESLEYNFKALNIQEQLGDKKHVAIELNNIGALYSDIGDHTKALIYFVKAKDISEKIGDDGSTAVFIGNIAHHYKFLCDSASDAGNTKLSLQYQDTALYYFQNAIGLSEKVSDKDNIAACLENIGIIYSNVENYQGSLPYLLRALELYKEQDLNAEQSFCLTLLGQSYSHTGQNKLAELCYAQALDIAKKTRSHYFLMNAYQGASEFYQLTGRHQEALGYYKNYVLFRDSMFNKENSNSLTRTEMNYEFDKKQAAIKFENDRIVYKLESENKLQKQWRIFFILVILLACVGLFFMKRAFDNKNKLAKILAEEDKRKEVLLQEVHHRINNNLQIISSLLTLQANSADNDQLSEYLMQSQNRIQSLSALHELLYDTNSPLEIKMTDYLEKILDFHREVAKTLAENITIQTEVEDVKFPTKLAVPLALIINELVTNSLKYAFKGLPSGIIKVTLGKNATDNNWFISIADNGKGMPPESQKRKDSLGLKLVGIMTRQIGGTLISKNENGAFFNVIFNGPKI